MPQDPVLAGLVYGTLLVSVATCLYLISIAVKKPLLPYEPRRSVPWNAIAAFPVTLYLLSTAASVWAELTATSEPPPPNASDVIYNLAGVIVQQLLIFGGLVGVTAIAFGATRIDLGLPPSGRQLRRDVAFGIVASLAALGPIHLLQGLLAYMMHMGEKSGHPLLKMIDQGEPNVAVLLLASVAAVVVAPICEELVFRLLFQGWLEKWEDERLGWREPHTNSAFDSEHDVTTADEAAAPITPPVELPPPTEPSDRGIVGLPHGWFPIIVSAILFGIAHTGYGPEPIPLFFLGVVLGYLYQRTHRIIPCIVAHAIFNLFTIVLLWRMMYAGN
jgi:membrane protease YdiL (CAAX protease family)